MLRSVVSVCLDEWLAIQGVGVAFGIVGAFGVAAVGAAVMWRRRIADDVLGTSGVGDLNAPFSAETSIENDPAKQYSEL